MQKSALKDLVFERFEERRLEIIKKRNRFQQELNQDVHHLRQAYGDAVLNGLGDMELSVATPSVQPPKGERQATPEAPQRSRRKSKGKRRRRSQGKPMARSLLENHATATVAAVAANKGEFQARDVYNHLKDVSKLDISPASVSLYLSQNAKKLGLVVEKRNVGEPIPRPTNFFHQRHKQAGEVSTKQSQAPGRIDWTGSIIAALEGLRKGLTQDQLRVKLRKAGIPEAKFQGAGFRGALARLVEEGTIHLTGERYHRS